MARRQERRRRVIKPHGPQPMYVIAGLPLALHRNAIALLEGRLKHAVIQGIPSPAKDGPLYSDRMIETLVRSVGQFAIRRRSKGNAQPTPNSIILLYTPAIDQEKLLQTFDFALMTAPLDALAEYDDDFKMRRHDWASVEQALLDAIAPAGYARSSLNEVTRRINYRSDNEGLLLPSNNFLIGDDVLANRFIEMRRGTRQWNDRFPELGPSDLTHADVPARISGQQTKHVFVDSRGMAFFIAHPKAYDGLKREVDESDDTAAILSVLRSLFRFGGALELGMHHDAQRSDGSELEGAVFNCETKGKIEAKGAYANIYPNDYVRVRDYNVAA